MATKRIQDLTNLGNITNGVVVVGEAVPGTTGKFTLATSGSGSVVLTTSPTLVTPLLGTPTSGVLTNCTGLPISTGVSGLASGAADFLATPSSANLATLVTDETGSGAAVFSTSPTLVTPLLGTPTSGVLTNCTGLPISSGVSGLAAGAATFLGTPSSANLATLLIDETGSGANVHATSPTLVTPLLGTPTSGVLTNCTGLPISTGVSGLAAGAADFLATPSSANLATLLTDETGSGANVHATSPTLVTPLLGTPTSGTLTNCTGLPISTGVSGLAAGAATFLATPSSANLATLLTDETGSGANVHATSPTLVTPLLGTPTSGTLTNCTGYLASNIVCITDASSAAAGKVGEVISSTVSAVAIASATFINVTSISLTAGDWVISGAVKSNPAGGTTQTVIACGISTTSATLPTMFSEMAVSVGAGNNSGLPCPNVRLNISGTTTVYLVALVTYAVSTLTIDGTIFARRVAH